MSRSVGIMCRVVKDLCFLCEGGKYTGVLSSVKAPIAVPGGQSSTEAAPKTASNQKKEMILIALKTANPPSTQEHICNGFFLNF